MNSIDIFIQNYFSSHQIVFLTKYFYVLTGIFDISVQFVLLVLCVMVLIYLFRGYKYSILFLGSLALSGVVVYALKMLFNTERPVGGMVDALGKSFPSGHTTISVVFFIILMYICDRYFSRVGRIVFNTFCMVSVIFISLSRLYLGVHWASDVGFGVILGGLISYTSITIFKKCVIK